ncbi:MAG: hypothetical protein RI554_10965 [Trueperaceae bacterium]|nr:hypothetical protein [Trueperaceae bacterium]
MTTYERLWVYGILDGTSAVYLPSRVARRWASLLGAWRTSSTWGAFWEAIDDEARSTVAATFLENGRWIPHDDDPIDAGAIPGMSAETWLGLPHLAMADLPPSVVRTFGTGSDSDASCGPVFRAADVPAINAALIREGFVLERDDDLVRRACGSGVGGRG